jgi:hypothetical protein
MASNTTKVRRKRARKQQRSGRARKVKQGRKSTLSYSELFAACGEVGEPAPVPAASRR